jgi:acetyl esterase/lipase
VRRISVPILVLTLLLGGCEGWSGTRTTDPAPTRIVEAERIGAPEGVRAWTIEYRSETIDGSPTTVTGWVAIPEVQGTIAILAWAHPIAGLGDDCAPSRAGGRTPFSFEAELSAGWAVVATDYEGLGGPGLHPYLVSESEARSIFDIARAARELDGRVGTELAVWGFSQGGHAAMSANVLAPTLAPEFTMLGIAAVAPAADLIGWPTAALGTSEQGHIAAIVAGYGAAYGIDPGTILTPEAIGLLDEVETSCADPTLLAIAELPAADAFVTDPARLEPWAGLLRENSPEFGTGVAPTLLVLGDQDELWPVDEAPVVLERMCAAGTPLTTAILIGEDHGSVNAAARGVVNSFLDERRAGVAFVSEC